MFLCRRCGSPDCSAFIPGSLWPRTPYMQVRACVLRTGTYMQLCNQRVRSSSDHVRLGTMDVRKGENTKERCRKGPLNLAAWSSKPLRWYIRSTSYRYKGT